MGGRLEYVEYYFIWASLPSIREDTLERTRVRLESRRVPPQGRATQYLTSPCWGPATKGGGLGLDQLGRPRARRQASTPRGLAASPKGIAPPREREELTMRRALRTTPLIPGEGGWGKRRTGAARVLARSQSLARPQSWHGHCARDYGAHWHGNRYTTGDA